MNPWSVNFSLSYRMFSTTIEHVFATLELLAKKRQELDALEAEWLAEVREFDRSGDWRVDGFLNAASAIRTVCRMNHGVARGYVELARKLEQLPEVADAFGRGEISSRHAAVIATAHTPERAAQLGEVEAQLVDIAREQTPKVLFDVVRHLTDAIDGDGGAAADEAARDRRYHHQSRTLDGMVAYDGLCDREAGERLRTAMEAELERDHRPQDGRTPSQRRADAHDNLMRMLLDGGALGSSRAARPHLTTAVDLDELKGAGPDLAIQVRAEVRRNGRLSPATLERLACDCDISRVITAGKSEILDVGRATRTISPALWKALVIRDGHCQAPGCDQPPERCEAHHIWHWLRGGPTNLGNLKLYCWHHHVEQHRHDAQPRARDG